MSGSKTVLGAIFLSFVALGCGTVEYTVIISQASRAIAEAETAGAHCTEEQLDSLSPVTRSKAVGPGQEIASTGGGGSVDTAASELGEPTCDAPYEYYSAVEYRRKAREEVGYSDYDAAVDYARRSRVMAEKARDIALNRAQEMGR